MYDTLATQLVAAEIAVPTAVKVIFMVVPSMTMSPFDDVAVAPVDNTAWPPRLDVAVGGLAPPTVNGRVPNVIANVLLVAVVLTAVRIPDNCS